MINRRNFISRSMAATIFLKSGAGMAQAQDLTELSLVEASALISQGSLSPVILPVLIWTG